MTVFPLRRTKIICTIGPASHNPVTLVEMAKTGMAIARLNMSHGDLTSKKAMVDSIRVVNKTSALPISIMIDTKGAEIRTGDVETPIVITKGQEVIFTSDKEYKDAKGRTVITINYNSFSNDVQEVERILLDNGELTFDIVGNEKKNVVGRAREDGKIGSRRHVNLPGADVDLPSITESDWKDIEFAVQEKADFLALSFIRTADDVLEVREYLKKHKSNMQIISKIETRKAVNNIGEILEASDGIMVARGDLGADVPFEELPVIQYEIVLRCRDAGKPVIVATQMLESMIHHPMPTRAEVTDTAYAVIMGADTTMLSGETAGGVNPVNVVEAMARIQYTTEKHITRFGSPFEIKLENAYEERAQELLTEALKENIDAIILKCTKDDSARVLSKFRSVIPIIAATADEELLTMLPIHYGVFPVHTKETSATALIAEAKKKDLVEKGQRVMVVAETFTEHSIEVAQ